MDTETKKDKAEYKSEDLSNNTAMPPDAGFPAGLAIPWTSNQSSWTLCQGSMSSSDSEDEDGTANTNTMDTETKKDKAEYKSEDLSNNTTMPPDAGFPAGL